MYVYKTVYECPFLHFVRLLRVFNLPLHFWQWSCNMVQRSTFFGSGGSKRRWVRRELSPAMWRCVVWQKGIKGFEERASSIVRVVEIFSAMKMGAAGFPHMLFNSGIWNWRYWTMKLGAICWLRNVGLSPNYTALQPRRPQTSSYMYFVPSFDLRLHLLNALLS
jgi:hypothetical protein